MLEEPLIQNPQNWPYLTVKITASTADEFFQILEARGRRDKPVEEPLGLHVLLPLSPFPASQEGLLKH